MACDFDCLLLRTRKPASCVEVNLAKSFGMDGCVEARA